MSGPERNAACFATFGPGVALSRVGSKRLDEAERRIEVLLGPSETKTGIERS